MPLSRKLVCSLLVLLLIVTTHSLPVSAGRFNDVASGELSVSAKAAVLIDASDGSILYSKNAGERLPMASTTKIMTAIVAIEKGDLERTYEIPQGAVGVEGSSIYLYAGERQSLGNLVYALMLESANDAAAAIAIIVGGSVEGFAEMMNKKAHELGLNDTHFDNPHGLDSAEHYTTAYDLAKISAYALKNNTFRDIASTRRATIPLNGTEGIRLLINHNKMLRYYEGAVGVKTGFTRKSGRCLVSAAERRGLTLVAVTLNAPNDWSDHTRMLDFGFNHYVRLSLEEKGGHRMTIPVTGGDGEWVLLTNTEEIAVTLPKDHGDISFVVEAPRFLYAPVKIGDVVGSIVYYSDGEVIGQSPLEAVTGVNAKKTGSFFLWLRRLFGID